MKTMLQIQNWNDFTVGILGMAVRKSPQVVSIVMYTGTIYVMVRKWRPVSVERIWILICQFGAFEMVRTKSRPAPR